MWKWLEQFFIFSRGDKRAILLLVLLTAIVFAIPYFYAFLIPVRHNDNEKEQKEILNFIAEFDAKRQSALTDSAEDADKETFNPYRDLELSPSFKKTKERKIEYFEFDPNKIGTSEWIRLGFSERQAESIEKLKLKGFKFRKPEDLSRVYVVSDKDYGRLLPYIRIDSTPFVRKVFEKPVYQEWSKEKFVVDINVADSSLFERQRGIGPSLASRIIRYRERLGGFVSTDQISEVWGIPDSTFQALKEGFVVNEVAIQKVDLNSTDFETIRKHPYFNYTFARVIVAYKKQHGNFKSVDDLLNIPIITDSIYRKMKPYVAID